jgi:hypothetical protein
MSREGFPSHLWGPGLWKFIHMTALNVPLNPTEEQKTGYKDFFNSLRYVLPCGTCRKEYTKLLGPTSTSRITPTTFASRANAFAWTVRLHRRVSRRLKKNKDLNPRINWEAQYERMRYHADPPKRMQKALVEFHPRDAATVRATVQAAGCRRVSLRISQDVRPGMYRVNRHHTFGSLADVLRVVC